MSTNATYVDPNATTTPTKRLLLSVKEVAAALGIGERSVWRLSARGELPEPLSIGRLKRWRRSAIESWVERAHRAAQKNANRA